MADFAPCDRLLQKTYSDDIHRIRSKNKLDFDVGVAKMSPLNNLAGYHLVEYLFKEGCYVGICIVDSMLSLTFVLFLHSLWRLVGSDVKN